MDFAQRIRPAPEKIRESREQQLSHASGILADLSKELGFCLLLGSQLNKEGAAKHAEAINEDADLHLQITQDSNKKHLGLAVVKDRHHGQGGRLLPIVLDDRLLRFVSRPITPRTHEHPIRQIPEVANLGSQLRSPQRRMGSSRFEIHRGPTSCRDRAGVFDSHTNPTAAASRMARKTDRPPDAVRDAQGRMPRKRPHRLPPMAERRMPTQTRAETRGNGRTQPEIEPMNALTQPLSPP